jgi:membrane protease YdiL (CAAX protease family)
MARHYPAATLLALATFAVSLRNGYLDGRSAQAAGYLLAVVLGVFVTDIVVARRPRPAVGFPIRWPIGQEVAAILGCTLLGLVYLALHFSSVGQAMPRSERLALFPILALFTFPVALALIYLLHYRYKPSELGINLRYLYLPLLVLLIFGAITFWIAPEESHWRSFFHQFGVWGWLFSGLLGAALSEEFTRMLLQTRLAGAFHNIGLGFVAATFIWACLHIPINHSQIQNAIWMRAFLGAITLMPVGFLWGYMTHRTKSILPAVLVHAFNLWGLVNF